MKSIKRNNLFYRQNVFIVLFLILCLLASIFPYFKIDLLITNKIQSINSPVFSNIMWFVSDIGNQPYISMIIGVICFLLYVFKLKTEAIICILATAGSALCGSLIKILIDRPRPNADLVHVWFKLLDNSFPSGHVLVFTVFFGFLLYLLFHKPKRNVKGMIFSILFFFFIATIGISRIFLGAHWASDVLGGYLLGILWLIFAIKLYNSYNGKR